jgi:phosphopantetheinyl transferase
MPLINFEQGNSELKLFIWKIEEEESFFINEISCIDHSQVELYRHPQARLQWLASRLLLFRHLGADNFQQLERNERGKIYLKDTNTNISISHSENMIAVAFSKKQFGIDIQKFTEKIPRLALKFIQEKDLNILQKQDSFFKTAHVHWGVKEAMFKADNEGKLDYRKNLILHWEGNYQVKGANFEARISKNEIDTMYTATYRELLEDFLLCTVTKL